MFLAIDVLRNVNVRRRLLSDPGRVDAANFAGKLTSQAPLAIGGAVWHSLCPVPHVQALYGTSVAGEFRPAGLSGRYFFPRLRCRDVMQIRELVDVAALVALNAPQLAAGSAAPDIEHLQQYWSTSKCRNESWSRALKAFAGLGAEAPRDNLDRWVDVRATLDEIFVSEILTRVWTAVLVTADRRSRVRSAESIARSVFDSHQEARRRALSLLVQGGPLSTQQAVAANRLRRRCERWTDVLLGGLWRLPAARHFAIDAERASDFAIDLSRRRASPGGHLSWKLTLASLRNAFQSGVSPVTANREANARVTASILGSFPLDMFDSTGLVQPVWMMRLSANASDAQGLVSELLEPALPPSPPVSGVPPKRRAY